MIYFLVANTAINLLAAIAGSSAFARIFCLTFALWGGYFLITQYWS